MRAGAATIAQLSEGIRVKILRTMCGRDRGWLLPYGDRTPIEKATIEREAAEAFGGEDDEPRYVISPHGRTLPPLTDELELWLLRGEEPLAYEDPRAKEAIELLAFAWDVGIAHALIEEPQSLGELFAVCGLERDWDEGLLEAAADLGLLDREENEDGEPVYSESAWFRHAAAPLLLATRIERDRADSEARPMTTPDIEVLLTMAMRGVMRVDEEVTGICRLEVKVGGRVAPQVALATGTVENGQLISAERGDLKTPTCQVSGDLRDWYRALIDLRPKQLTYTGDRFVVRKLVEAMGTELFGEDDTDLLDMEMD